MSEPTLPLWLIDSFQPIHVNAIRTGARGRASGGMLILIKKNITFNLLQSLYNTILLEIICNNSENFLLGCIYLKPNDNLSEIIDTISQTLENRTDIQKVIIGGDMNCHVGESGVTLDEDLTEGTELHTTRYSLHKEISSRGEEFLLKTEELGLVLLNGRYTCSVYFYRYKKE